MEVAEVELPYRQLGNTDIKSRVIGLGCASLGNESHTDREAVEAVRCAVELGINFIDTSPLYRESERRLGLALEGGYREKIYLETKTGTHPEKWGDYSPEATRWSVENSLRLLKTDYLDAVLVHDPADIEMPFTSDYAVDELLKMKEKGLVRYIGLGVRQHEFHIRAIESGKMDIVLTFLDYTLLDQSAAGDIVPLAQKSGVGIILGSVLGSGQLTGVEPDPDTRAHAMWKWCEDRGMNIRDFALQFCMALPIQGIVMPGPGSRKHVEEVYESATREIPPELWAAFRGEFGVGI